MKITPISQGNSLPADMKNDQTTNQRLKTLKANALAAWASPGGVKATEATPEPEISVAAAAALGAAPSPNISAPPSPEPEIAPEGQENTLEATASVSDEALPEAPVEEPKATETAPDPLSSQYAILARKEKALRAKQQQQEQAIKAREEALAAREAEIARAGEQYKSGYIKADTLKNNPLQALAEAGISYDDLTQQILNQGSVDPRVNAQFEALQAEIKALREEKAKEREAQNSQQTEAYNRAVAKIAADTKKLVFTDPAYEMIKATNSVNDVVELIKEHHKETGEVLSVEEAAQQVEDYLVEQAIKLTKAEKIRKQFESVAPKQVEAAKPQTPASPPAQAKQTQPQIKTLTNANTAPRKLSARERAHLAFKGEKVS